jgi:hypothetical protein
MSDDANEKADQKIIIDEDWKSQVEAEKEELQRKKQEPEASEPTTETEAEPENSAADTEAGAPESGADADVPLPPPSLEFLTASLGMQAMIAMGLMPNPMTGKAEVHFHQAKHLIDTIALLEEKTEGNRTPEETAALGNLLHELRMGFVAVQRQQAD